MWVCVWHLLYEIRSPSPHFSSPPLLFPPQVEAQLKLEDARKAAQGSAEQARLRRERIRALRATLRQQMQQ